MKKLIYGLLALAILAVAAITASSEENPNLVDCIFAPDIQVFEKTIPGPGLEEYMYWDKEGNYLGKERWDPVTRVCVTDTYAGCCIEDKDICDGRTDYPTCGI